MLFNSFEFLLFLPLVFTVYWALNWLPKQRSGLKGQNLWLLASSYVFYGWWDWRFLSLIAFSTAVDWTVGILIEQANHCDQPKNPSHRSKVARRWLALSLIVNLGMLGYFKYSNFFIENWIEAWSSIGIHMEAWSVKVILPVGISFYTFQTLSYSLDIYRRKLSPTRDLIEFAAFVSFFPQLVAGPIERASSLLPQIASRRRFDFENGVLGLKLILWGMFKKVVVADTCAIYVNEVFDHHTAYSGPSLAIGAAFFALQIYGDFSGYSDIAIGTARLFGIKLMTNFKRPYFSRDIAEFWRRWHISLSTWFRDYLYIPLGGSRAGKWKAVRNTFIIFLVSGFWHGANWTFIAWGFIHAVLFLPLLMTGQNRKYIGDVSGLPSFRQMTGMILTFIAVTFSWIFFRSASMLDAHLYLKAIAAFQPGNSIFDFVGKLDLMFLFTSLTLGFLMEITQDRMLNGQRTNPLFWGAIVLLIFAYSAHNHSDSFIYFQF